MRGKSFHRFPLTSLGGLGLVLPRQFSGSFVVPITPGLWKVLGGVCPVALADVHLQTPLRSLSLPCARTGHSADLRYLTARPDA